MFKERPQDPATLRTIFFPVQGDFGNKSMKWLSKDDQAKGPRTLNTAFTIQGGTFTLRHPTLLFNLDDDTYKAVFQRIVAADRRTKVKSWGAITNLIRLVEQVIPRLLMHIIYWWDMRFRKPSNADRALHDFDFVQVIAQTVMSRRRIEGVTRGPAMTDADAAQGFVTELIKSVMMKKDIWREKSLDAWVGPESNHGCIITL